MKMIRMALVGVLLMMLVMPAVATDITIYMDIGNGWEVAENSHQYQVDANTECRFKANYSGWGSGTMYVFNVTNSSAWIGGESGTSSTDTWETGVVTYTISLDETVFVEAAAANFAKKKISVTASTVTGVPEPTTLALTALGMLGVLGFVRRRREE
ncbi:MAG: membrane protein containing PEP-CTERM bacterial domain protein [Candidatus Syntrophoarchaeum caldarius]|uniref:Membrane protein containing PEP-CTERM bacterial domain protein n=1 Tax=Candidatus Syntropharchaeum caldarium TaxID=1838285 RepID=A0A1F2PAS0_9EURY|nr:MAG: membrane protein containing PEP-CTERM bacterial domain protein [Candidatus Syntrophoarchaeum caldarius]